MAATHADHHAEHASHGPITVPEALVDVSKLRLFAIVAMVVGFAVYLIGGFVNLGTDKHYGLRDFFLAYQCAYVYWVCIPFGSVGLSMIGFLMQASWGIILRRIFQANMKCLPLLFILGLPVLAGLVIENGNQSPFWWSSTDYDGLDEAEKKRIVSERVDGIVADEKEKGKDADAAKIEADLKHQIEDEIGKFKKQGWTGIDHGHDKDKTAEIAAYRGTNPHAIEEAQHKVNDFLNPKFFAVRYFAYFAIIGALAYFVLRNAKRHDEDGEAAGKTAAFNMSGPGMVIFVLTLTLFATDFVMSVEETWASSMFPVIFGMNMFLTTFTFSTLVLYTLTRVPGDNANPAGRPDLTGFVKEKFRIDIGSLTFGFCMVWAYGSFCQFMLIWAGNLPEEITYYLKRGANRDDSAVGTGSGWIYLTYALMLFHWAIPFITLLVREVKTSPKAMKVVTTMLLLVCACDVIWWILPCVPHETSFMHVPMAFGAILGVGGLYAFAFASQLQKKSIVVQGPDGQFVAEWGHHH